LQLKETLQFVVNHQELSCRIYVW